MWICDHSTTGALVRSGEEAWCAEVFVNDDLQKSFHSTFAIPYSLIKLKTEKRQFYMSHNEHKSNQTTQYLEAHAIFFKLPYFHNFGKNPI